MNAWLKLAGIVLVATFIGSVASHSAMHWLKIRSGYSDYQRFGTQDQAVPALTILHGSSLAYDGITWSRISQVLGGLYRDLGYGRLLSNRVGSSARSLAAGRSGDRRCFPLRSERILAMRFPRRHRALRAAQSAICSIVDRTAALQEDHQSISTNAGSRSFFPPQEDPTGCMVGFRASLYGLANRAARRGGGGGAQVWIRRRIGNCAEAE